jgi:proteasome lid subunit RPN8/RPN11
MTDQPENETEDLSIALTSESDGPASAQAEPAPSAAPPSVAAPRLFLSAEAMAAMREHGLTDTSRECGGVMVGQKLEGEKGPVVLVEAVIPAALAQGHHGSLTFTHEAWDHINQVKDQDYADLRIVGWYHTHPGFGIFLSDYDEFIQKNFFDLPWHVAFVLDPHSGDTGAFGWVEGAITRLPNYDVYGVGEAPPPPMTPQPSVAVAPIAPPVRAAASSGWVTVALVLGLLVILSLLTLGEIAALRGQIQSLEIAAPITAPAAAAKAAPATEPAGATTAAPAEAQSEKPTGGETTGGGGATEPGRTGD